MSSTITPTYTNSVDGSLYVGWFPEGRPGNRSEGWKIAVSGTAEMPGYSITFTTDTPAHIVNAAVAALLDAAPAA
ncbi:DUF317 domain-containing protein [Streptomyces sp. NPDC005408]|uniref:DUF317 domain-containing protein n=1 Tax=Streptomyces sp. NPDC005408 TaxID=3155341 RepID=UPI0033B5AF57